MREVRGRGQRSGPIIIDAVVPEDERTELGQGGRISERLCPIIADDVVAELESDEVLQRGGLFYEARARPVIVSSAK